MASSNEILLGGDNESKYFDDAYFGPDEDPYVDEAYFGPGALVDPDRYTLDEMESVVDDGDDQSQGVGGSASSPVEAPRVKGRPSQWGSGWTEAEPNCLYLLLGMGKTYNGRQLQTISHIVALPPVKANMTDYERLNAACILGLRARRPSCTSSISANRT